MSRVKGGVTNRQKHKKILKLAKGYRMTRRRLYSKAKEAVLHAGEYAYVGRKDRKSQFRRLWIVRLNGALRAMGLKYNQFIQNLKKKDVQIDRKILAKLAAEKPNIFTKLVEQISK